MIILHFDARERLALGNSCKRFNDLVFGDEKLLRNLDFTRAAHLTKESDIQQYFNDEDTYKKILRIKIENVHVAENLSSSISKAINLVELNILDELEFDCAEDLSLFLQPLVHLKRLSIDWPQSAMILDVDSPDWNECYGEPWRRLTYLSLEIDLYSDDFLLILRHCQQLEELHMSIPGHEFSYEIPFRPELTKLSNLKLVRLDVSDGYLGLLKNYMMSIVPKPDEWTDFYLVNFHFEAYLERSVEVCAELEKVKKMPLPQYIADVCDTGFIGKGWPLVPENLLSEVIRVTHEDVPEKFCCLSASRHPDLYPCLLEIGEAKKLLKDPGNQISSLHCSHIIHKNCDLYLLASAFPELTKLVLSWIGYTNFPWPTEETKPLHTQRRLRKIGSPASEEDSDAGSTDSTFKMLVDNTPRLKALQICAKSCEKELPDWDLDALDLISGWTNLTAIYLSNVPIRDEKFLIHIGKECKNLEEVTLYDLGPNKSNSYESELLQMLQHCKNLRKLSFGTMCLEHLSEMFNILSNCSKLAALRLQTITRECDILELTSSVENMLRKCQDLKLFSLDLYQYQFCRALRSHVDRIISELNRPNFKFRLGTPIHG